MNTQKIKQTANLDLQEIAKFDALSNSWWDPHGEFKPLHELNPLRLNFIQDHTPLAEKNVIDIGCGGGILTESLAKLNAHATGIDLSENAIAIAKQHAHSENLTINYQVIDVEKFAEQHAETFDVVTCMELLEHVPDPARLIAACAKLAKPNGKLFFSTINRNPKAYLLAIIAAEYVLQWLAKGTHDYAKFIKPAELAQWLRAADLEAKEFKGIVYRPLSREYQLTNNVDVNYLVYCEKI